MDMVMQKGVFWNKAFLLGSTCLFTVQRYCSYVSIEKRQLTSIARNWIVKKKFKQANYPKKDIALIA